MSAKGQTLNDRLNAAKYTLAGQALARCICKATTEELMRPKKKHLDYLSACTYESNVSMQQLTNMLIERTNHSNWIVVYKALITVHHLMSFGSERFTQYLASSNYSFQLSNFNSNFLDRIAARGYAMSTFIRRYSNYINQKALSYRTLAMDLCKAQRRGDDSILRTIGFERLIETLPTIQKQLDALLDFGCNADDLDNSIITASFTLLFHDAIRLFARYNDGIINLIEKYFDLNKKMCREAFEAYKRFLASTDRVVEFLKVAESINLNSGELPDFKRAPGSLLDAFEQHLTSLEGNKRRDDSKKFESDFRPKLQESKTTAPFLKFSDNKAFENQQATLGDISREFEEQLSFAPGECDEPKAEDIGDQPNKALSKDLQSISNINNDDIKVTQNQVSSISIDLFEPSLENKDVLDLQPPGFSDGSMLVPEALQISIDPSIDPHTQQQLIQIKREQVANRYNKNGVQSPQPKNEASSKPTKESMFEDLEKTMRESMMKI